MRQPNYPDAKHDNEFERGLRFQDFVVETLAKRAGLVIQIYSSQRYQFNDGESIQGWEIKLDDWCTKSNRLSIEIAEKSNKYMPNWTPSGIYREDNTIFYVQGNYSVFWVFFRKHLIYHFEKKNPYVMEKRGTIKTWYLPADLADFYGWRIDTEENRQASLF